MEVVTDKTIVSLISEKYGHDARRICTYQKLETRPVCLLVHE